MIRQAHELDYVELIAAVDGWPAGTKGTVVAEEAETALVELSPRYGTDADGFTLGDPLDLLLDVPYGDLKVVKPYTPRAG